MLYLEGFDEFPNRLSLSQHNGVVEYRPVVVDAAIAGRHKAQPPFAVDDVDVVDQLCGGIHVAQLHGED